MNLIPPKELYQRVDEVLYYIWDPIGVKEEPCARGEYSCYVTSVVEVVLNKKDPKAIAALLMSIESERIEMTTGEDHCRKVAELLLEHKRALEEGLS